VQTEGELTLPFMHSHPSSTMHFMQPFNKPLSHSSLKVTQLSPHLEHTDGRPSHVYPGIIKQSAHPGSNPSHSSIPSIKLFPHSVQIEFEQSQPGADP